METKKPKSWLKSVSAFANGIGGILFFGVDNDGKMAGLTNVQTDAEAISRLIKERITPLPQFVLTPVQEDDKDALVLSVAAGCNTPYYYKADGIMEAYVRVGNESITAPDYVSFGLADKDGFLTNAGKLLTDQHIVYNSRVFCTRWNGAEIIIKYLQLSFSDKLSGCLISCLK